MSTPIHLPRRRFLGMLGAGAGVTLLGTSACSGSGSDRSGIEVWALEDENVNPVTQASLDRFNAGSDVKASLVTEPNDGYRDAVHISIDTPQRPDVFFNWGGGSIRTYARANMLVDLTSHLNDDPAFKDSFLPSVLDAGMIDDKYYGIPMRTMQPKHMFYNMDVLADAGLEPPTTWDGFLDTCDRLSGNGITPMALAGATNWTMLMWIEYLTDRLGGSQVFTDIADGVDGAWRHPAITEAVNTIIDLVDRGVFGTNFASVSWDGGAVQALVSEGKAAMHLMGSWEYTEQLGLAPDFARNSLGWGAFPAIEHGAGDPLAVAGNPTNYFSITQESDHVDEAIEYLKTMATDEYVDELIGIGDVPAVANIEERLKAAEHAEYAQFVYQTVVDAPSFQLSWDQALETSLGEPMLIALEQVFLGELDADGFIQANEDAAA